MSAPDGWRDKARALHAQDPTLTYAEIGRRCGVHRAMVTKALNPERTREWNRKANARRNAAKRVWENEHDRGVCPKCGGLMSVGANRKGSAQCQPCRRADDRRHLRARAERIAALWANGRTLQEIATELGWSKGHLGNEVDRIRSNWPGLIPYRYRTYAGRELPR